MKSEPLLRVESLSKNFGGVRGVIDVSFELKEGEALGIIGPNGSGKTTLVNLIVAETSLV
jgi:branched-chain amino acid transport system ATP-binding protein